MGDTCREHYRIWLAMRHCPARVLSVSPRDAAGRKYAGARARISTELPDSRKLKPCMPHGSRIQPGMGMLPDRAAITTVERIIRQYLRHNHTRTFIHEGNAQREFIRTKPARMVYAEIPGHRFIGAVPARMSRHARPPIVFAVQSCSLSSAARGSARLSPALNIGSNPGNRIVGMGMLDRQARYHYNRQKAVPPLWKIHAQRLRRIRFGERYRIPMGHTGLMGPASPINRFVPVNFSQAYSPAAYPDRGRARRSPRSRG